MTPDDLSLLIERLLDDALTPSERHALAARLADDADLHQRVASELALALQIRAELAEDAEQRADLLLATVSGSRRLAMASRIDRAIDAAARPTSARWLPWSSLAAAALLVILVGGWWLLRTAPGMPTRTIAIIAPTPPTAVPLTIRAPSRITTVEPETTDAIIPSEPAPFVEVVVTQIPDASPVPDIAAAEPAPAPIPANATPVAARPIDHDTAHALSATQANSTLAKPDPKALKLMHPLLINGSAQVHRQGRAAMSESNMRLVPGDEVHVHGDGADMSDDRGLTWWCSPDTRLILPIPRVVDAARQPLHVTLGTVHVTAGPGLRPLITTPHLRIDAEEADLWLTVTTRSTRVETISGSVRLDIAITSTRPGALAVRPGIKTVHPLAPGFYAMTLPGQALEIHPSGQGRLSVINGRFTRDGDLHLPRILRGVSATVAADLGATAMLAPLGDAAWLDQAAYRHLNALVDLPATVPSTMPTARIFKHPALSAWVATSDIRAASAMQRADPLRPIHLAGAPPAKLPAWASSSELASSGDAAATRATLAVVAVDDQVQLNSWDAMIRGAQGLIWTVDDQHRTAVETLRPLTVALDATQGLLTDGTRVHLDLGHAIAAAQWDRPGRRLIVVVNHNGNEHTVEIPHSRGLEPVGADESFAVTTSGDLTTAALPVGGVLVLQGPVP